MNTQTLDLTATAITGAAVVVDTPAADSKPQRKSPTASGAPKLTWHDGKGNVDGKARLADGSVIANRVSDGNGKFHAKIKGVDGNWSRLPGAATSWDAAYSRIVAWHKANHAATA